MSKIIVLYCLKPQVTEKEYEKYFRDEKYSIVMSFPSVNTFKLNRVTETLQGEKSADYIGILEVENLDSYQRDRETQEFQEFLAKWINFVEPSSIRVFYTEEVRLS